MGRATLDEYLQAAYDNSRLGAASSNDHYLKEAGGEMAIRYKRALEGGFEDKVGFCLEEIRDCAKSAATFGKDSDLLKEDFRKRTLAWVKMLESLYAENV